MSEETIIRKYQDEIKSGQIADKTPAMKSNKQIKLH